MMKFQVILLRLCWNINRTNWETQDNDYKKIADLVDERINKAFEPVKKDLTQVKIDLAEVKQDLNEVKDMQENRVLPSVTEIEATIKSYADSYKINKHNIERLNTRLSSPEFPTFST